MRQFRFVFVSILTSLFVVNAVFWRKATTIFLCSVLSFNSTSCYVFFDKGVIANATASRNINTVFSNLPNVPASISSIPPETQKKLISSTASLKAHRHPQGGNSKIESVTFPPGLSLDLNKALDQILRLISSTEKFQLVIVNQTPHTLTRVGSYNDLSNWPLVDVPALTARYRDWTENGFGYFSFAANYAVVDTGKYFQFAASWPAVGASRKINLCTFNESGNAPAQKCWEAMNDSNDKPPTNDKLTGRAIIAKENGGNQWIYQVVERKEKEKEQSRVKKPSDKSLRAYAESYIRDWGTHPQNGSLPTVSPIRSLIIEATSYPEFPYSGSVTTEAYPTLLFLFYYGKNGWITNSERIRIQGK